MWLPSSDEEIDEVFLVIHIANGLVQGIHHDQSMVLQGTVRVKIIGILYRAKLFKHGLHILAVIKHPETSRTVVYKCIGFNWNNYTQ